MSRTCLHAGRLCCQPGLAGPLIRSVCLLTQQQGKRAASWQAGGRALQGLLVCGALAQEALELLLPARAGSASSPQVNPNAASRGPGQHLASELGWLSGLRLGGMDMVAGVCGLGPGRLFCCFWAAGSAASGVGPGCPAGLKKRVMFILAALGIQPAALDQPSGLTKSRSWATNSKLSPTLLSSDLADRLGGSVGAWQSARLQACAVGCEDPWNGRPRRGPQARPPLGFGPGAVERGTGRLHEQAGRPGGWGQDQVLCWQGCAAGACLCACAPPGIGPPFRPSPPSP